jgi:hypothetical protein
MNLIAITESVSAVSDVVILGAIVFTETFQF